MYGRWPASDDIDNGFGEDIGLNPAPAPALTLTLTLIKKTDHIPEKEYDLSGILTGKRFDWSAANLDDISITLDYSGNIISVTIIDWQTGMESEIVI
mgnify:CR=1 FL=1